jgi:hypothetical protein
MPMCPRKDERLATRSYELVSASLTRKQQAELAAQRGKRRAAEIPTNLAAPSENPIRSGFAVIDRMGHDRNRWLSS